MKKSKQNVSKRIKLIFTGLLLIGGLTANAQITLPGGGDPDISDAPIDGFISIALIAGACIGVRKRIKGIKE